MHAGNLGIFPSPQEGMRTLTVPSRPPRGLATRGYLLSGWICTLWTVHVNGHMVRGLSVRLLSPNSASAQIADDRAVAGIRMSPPPALDGSSPSGDAVRWLCLGTRPVSPTAPQHARASRLVLTFECQAARSRGWNGLPLGRGGLRWSRMPGLA